MASFPPDFKQEFIHIDSKKAGVPATLLTYI